MSAQTPPATVSVFRRLRMLMVVVIVVTLAAVLFLIGLVALLKAPGRQVMQAATPPAVVTNLVSFLQWMPTPKAAFQVEESGSTYVILTGPTGQIQRGDDAAYVFDGTGRLVGWSPDTGDHLPDPIGRPRGEWRSIDLDSVVTNAAAVR